MPNCMWFYCFFLLCLANKWWWWWPWWWCWQWHYCRQWRREWRSSSGQCSGTRTIPSQPKLTIFFDRKSWCSLTWSYVISVGISVSVWWYFVGRVEIHYFVLSPRAYPDFRRHCLINAMIFMRIDCVDRIITLMIISVKYVRHIYVFLCLSVRWLAFLSFRILSSKRRKSSTNSKRNCWNSCAFWQERIVENWNSDIPF